jgi:hypothetical protein
MLRLSWPMVLIGAALVALVARRPGLLFSRAFFPVLLVAFILLLAGYTRRARGPKDR